MKQNNKYNNQTKFSNQDLENIIKISQNSNNKISNLNQNEILQRSLELLYPGQDKGKILDKLNVTNNYNNRKNEEFSTQPKSTKNIDNESVNIQTKSSKTPEKIIKKTIKSNRSLTPKSKTNTSLFKVNKFNNLKTNLNKSVSLRENSKLKESLNKSGMTNQDNVKTLETLINEIKYYGFNRTKLEINDKLKIKQEIEASIDSLQKKKTNLYIESKQLNTNHSKIVNETHVFQSKSERMKREVYFFNKDIPNIYQEIEDINYEIVSRKNENSILNNEILNHEKEVLLIKDEIRRMNKIITNDQKEKENILKSINLHNKHIVLLNSKVRDEEKKSKEFLNNISVFIEKGVKQQGYK